MYGVMMNQIVEKYGDKRRISQADVKNIPKVIKDLAEGKGNWKELSNNKEITQSLINGVELYLNTVELDAEEVSNVILG